MVQERLLREALGKMKMKFGRASYLLDCERENLFIYKGLAGKNDPLTPFLVSQNVGAVRK